MRFIISMASELTEADIRAGGVSVRRVIARSPEDCRIEVLASLSRSQSVDRLLLKLKTKSGDSYVQRFVVSGAIRMLIHCITSYTECILNYMFCFTSCGLVLRGPPRFPITSMAPGIK